MAVDRPTDEPKDRPTDQPTNQPIEQTKLISVPKSLRTIGLTDTVC